MLASVVVGAALVLSTVLVVSLIGGDDNPEVNTEKPPADEQLPQDEPAADEPSTLDVPDDAPDSDDASVDDDSPDADDASEDLPEKSDGKGEKNGNLHRHKEANFAVDQQNCEKNELEHAVEEVAAEDEMSEESGLRAGERNCGDGGEGKCQSRDQAES